MTDTQNQKIMNYLKCTPKGISTIESFTMFGITRLGSRINELRKEHDIRDVWEKSTNGKRYKRYYLPAKPCQTASAGMGEE